MISRLINVYVSISIAAANSKQSCSPLRLPDAIRFTLSECKSQWSSSYTSNAYKTLYTYLREWTGAVEIAPQIFAIYLHICVIFARVLFINSILYCMWIVLMLFQLRAWLHITWFHRKCRLLPIPAILLRQLQYRRKGLNDEHRNGSGYGHCCSAHVDNGVHYVHWLAAIAIITSRTSSSECMVTFDLIDELCSQGNRSHFNVHEFHDAYQHSMPF